MEPSDSSRGQRLREELFNLYCSHLESFSEDHLQFEVQRQDGTSFFPPLGEFYICPLCFGCFYRNALAEPPDTSPLTIEDVPPKSVSKGMRRTKVLTCRSCNSTAGSRAESQLELAMAWSDFAPGHADGWRKCTLRTAEGAVRAHVSVGDNRALRFEVVGDASRGGRDAFFADLRKRLQFKLSMPYPDRQRSNAALLKSAFLLVFASFGYSYILSTPALTAVRDKIKDPNGDCLLDSAIKPLPKGLSRGSSGPSISVVLEPVELQSLFVALNLRRYGTDRDWGIFLPGPGSHDVSLYEALKHQSQSFQIRAVEVLASAPGSQAPVREPDARHLIQRFWRDLRES